MGAYAGGHMSGTAAKAVGSNAGFWLETQRRALRGIDALTLWVRGGVEGAAVHLETGLRGEEEALFHLRRLGYTIVARRWTSPRARGDVDLIGWDGEWLCFIEVKTRTGRDWVPAEFAVDGAKQETLRRLARAYLRGFPEERRRSIRVRFDVVSVYFRRSGGGMDGGRGVEIEVFPRAFARSAAERWGWSRGSDAGRHYGN
jgi:putative endonuclease